MLAFTYPVKPIPKKNPDLVAISRCTRVMNDIELTVGKAPIASSSGPKWAHIGDSDDEKDLRDMGGLLNPEAEIDELAESSDEGKLYDYISLLKLPYNTLTMTLNQSTHRSPSCDNAPIGDNFLAVNGHGRAIWYEF